MQTWITEILTCQTGYKHTDKCKKGMMSLSLPHEKTQEAHKTKACW